MKLHDSERVNTEARIRYGSLRHHTLARNGFREGARWQARVDEEKLTKLVEALKELLVAESKPSGLYFENLSTAKSKCRAALKEIGEEV